MILRHKYSKWLESSIEKDFCMWFAVWSFHLAICYFAFFKHSFWCKNRWLKRVSYLLIFIIWENKIVMSMIHDPLFLPFVNHAKDPSCTTLFIISFSLFRRMGGWWRRVGLDGMKNTGRVPFHQNFRKSQFKIEWNRHFPEIRFENFGSPLKVVLFSWNLEIPEISCSIWHFYPVWVCSSSFSREKLQDGSEPFESTLH